MSEKPGDEERRWPSYLELQAAGELSRRAIAARDHLRACDLCPRHCGADRLNGELGYCRAGALARVASHTVHRWEEPPISGTRGSGTIFFAHCTARCVFCQNYPISQLGVGRDVDSPQLGAMMLALRREGCHNINLVTPTHYVPQFLSALEWAVPRGLCIPIVYNSSGYDDANMLRLLDGVVDIYLPDAKYADDDVARRLSGFAGYVEANRAALLEMRRQVGEVLSVDDHGIARRGLIVRHLVLPDGLSQTPTVLQWISDNLSPASYVSLMSQYFPAHRAVGDAHLGRALTFDEYEQALEAFDAAGLVNGWRQEVDPIDDL